MDCNWLHWVARISSLAYAQAEGHWNDRTAYFNVLRQPHHTKIHGDQPREVWSVCQHTRFMTNEESISQMERGRNFKRFAASNAVSNHESFIMSTSDWRTATAGCVQTTTTLQVFRQCCFSSFIDKPRLSRCCLPCRSINQWTLGNEDLHAISIFWIMRGLVLALERYRSI